MKSGQSLSGSHRGELLVPDKSAGKLSHVSEGTDFLSLSNMSNMDSGPLSVE